MGREKACSNPANGRSHDLAKLFHDPPKYKGPISKQTKELSNIKSIEDAAFATSGHQEIEDIDQAVNRLHGQT